MLVVMLVVFICVSSCDGDDCGSGVESTVDPFFFICDDAVSAEEEEEEEEEEDDDDDDDVDVDNGSCPRGESVGGGDLSDAKAFGYSLRAAGRSRLSPADAEDNPPSYGRQETFVSDRCSSSSIVEVLL
jgi:hypothetical protein